MPFIALLLVYIAALFAAFTGYVLNISALLGDAVMSNGEMGVRLVGIIMPPVGAIMGLFF